MIRISTAALIAACAAFTLTLTACGGGDVSGTVSGLDTGTSVVLQNNATDSLTVSANGAFSFASGLAASATYDVTVLTQPVGETCTVSSGSGTLDTNADSVENVSVVCTATSSVIGTLSGLAAGTAVSLTDGTSPLALAANGAFAFPEVLASGKAVAVTVVTQPAGQTCTVTNGTGTFETGSQINVTVTCS